MVSASFQVQKDQKTQHTRFYVAQLNIPLVKFRSEVTCNAKRWCYEPVWLYISSHTKNPEHFHSASSEFAEGWTPGLGHCLVKMFKQSSSRLWVLWKSLFSTADRNLRPAAMFETMLSVQFDGCQMSPFRAWGGGSEASTTSCLGQMAALLLTTKQESITMFLLEKEHMYLR